MMSSVPLNPGDSTFVDLCCGSGRRLILAARAGFRRVVGVELDADLTQEAEVNIRRWEKSRRGPRRPGQEVLAVQGDAAAFTLPGGPVLIFLFNSFGTETMRRVISNACSRVR